MSIGRDLKAWKDGASSVVPAEGGRVPREYEKVLPPRKITGPAGTASGRRYQPRFGSAIGGFTLSGWRLARAEL